MSDDTASRSARAETRNPLLTLPSYHRLLTLPPEAQQALRDVLGDLRQDAAGRAEEA